MDTVPRTNDYGVQLTISHDMGLSQDFIRPPSNLVKSHGSTSSSTTKLGIVNGMPYPLLLSFIPQIVKINNGNRRSDNLCDIAEDIT